MVDGEKDVVHTPPPSPRSGANGAKVMGHSPLPSPRGKGGSEGKKAWQATRTKWVEEQDSDSDSKSCSPTHVDVGNRQETGETFVFNPKSPPVSGTCGDPILEACAAADMKSDQKNTTSTVHSPDTAPVSSISPPSSAQTTEKGVAEKNTSSNTWIKINNYADDKADAAADGENGFSEGRRPQAASGLTVDVALLSSSPESVCSATSPTDGLTPGIKVFSARKVEGQEPADEASPQTPSSSHRPLPGGLMLQDIRAEYNRSISTPSQGSRNNLEKALEDAAEGHAASAMAEESDDAHDSAHAHQPHDSACKIKVFQGKSDIQQPHFDNDNEALGALEPEAAPGIKVFSARKIEAADEASPHTSSSIPLPVGPRLHSIRAEYNRSVNSPSMEGSGNHARTLAGDEGEEGVLDEDPKLQDFPPLDSTNEALLGSASEGLPQRARKAKNKENDKKDKKDKNDPEYQWQLKKQEELRHLMAERDKLQTHESATPDTSSSSLLPAASSSVLPTASTPTHPPTHPPSAAEEGVVNGGKTREGEDAGAEGTNEVKGSSSFDLLSEGNWGDGVWGPDGVYMPPPARHRRVSDVKSSSFNADAAAAEAAAAAAAAPSGSSTAAAAAAANTFETAAALPLASVSDFSEIEEVDVEGVPAVNSNGTPFSRWSAEKSKSVASSLAAGDSHANASLSAYTCIR